MVDGGQGRHAVAPVDMHLQQSHSTEGPVHEVVPEACPFGHPWGPNQVLVGWMPCQCAKVGGGHRYYACRSCDAVVYRPDHDAELAAEGVARPSCG